MSQHAPGYSHLHAKVFPFPNQSIKSGRADCFFKCTDNYAKATRIMRNQGNRIPPKEYSKPPVISPQRNGNLGSAPQKIQNNFLNILREHQQFNNVKKKVQEQNEKFKKRFFKNIKNQIPIGNFGEEDND